MTTHALLTGAASAVAPLALVALRVSLLLLTILLAALLLGPRRAALRSFLWRLGLIGTFVVPLLLAWGPGWRLSPDFPVRILPAAQPHSQLLVFTPAPEVPEAAPLGRSAQGRPAADPRETTTTPVGTGASLLQDLGHVVVPVYALGLVILLLRLGLACHAMRRFAGSATEAIDDTLRRRLREVGDSLGLRRSVRVALSDSVCCPTLVGAFRPTLLLPRETDVSRVPDGVLIHELAHARLHSVLFNLVGSVAVACHWYNPLIWIAARCERQAGEHRCDDWATTLGRDWNGYAHTLLEVATSLRPFRASMAAQLLRPTGLVGRLARIEALRDTASPRIGAVGYGLTAGLGVLGVLVLGVPPRQASALPSPPVDLSAYSDRWEFTWLPVGAVVGHAGNSMNEEGQIAGQCREGDTVQGCRWSTGSVALDHIQVGVVRSSGAVVTRHGMVAGTADTEDMPLAVPYLWRDGALTLLPTLGGPQMAITDANERGQVVGWGSSPDNSQMAYVASADTAIALPTLGGKYGMAMAITEDGAIAGDSDREDGHNVPCYWHPETGVQELWYPPRFDGGSARAMTEDGRILVDLHECDWGNRWDSNTCRVVGSPFLWTFNGRKDPDGHWIGDYAPLPKPTGYDDVRGRSLNARGDVLLHASNRDMPRDEWVDFLVVDDRLVELPQPESGGTMHYYSLNEQGWLAGNLMVPQGDESASAVGEAVVGFIAIPRGR